MPGNKQLIITVEPPRKRAAPSTAFKKGGTNPHAFPKGVCPNPGGRPKDGLRLVSKALRAQLGSRAPNAEALAVGLPPGASWAQCVATAMLLQAVRGDVAAARLIFDCTEGSKARLGPTDENGDPLKPPSLHVHFVSMEKELIAERETLLIEGNTLENEIKL